ncbi:hypothetical protein ACFLSA_03000 [Bacteroidota bacterium]
MRKETTTPDTRLADWPLLFNPVAIKGLVQLMWGGNAVGRIYSLHCRARYFDPEKRRAGLPDDVAALVLKMDDEWTEIILINVNQIHSRSVLVQTGIYGEHQCEFVEVNNEKYQVNNRYFKVNLDPGAGAVFSIKTVRYANQPTLAFPWHGTTVPGSF